MTAYAIPQKPVTLHEDRQCGSCYACCVHLGIEELHKYSGQTCRHLYGGSDPAKRCSIYATRPSACAEYRCLWREGWGDDNFQPSLSGFLVTGYPSERGEGISFTVLVFDKKLSEPHISDLISQLIMLPLVDEVRLVFLQEKSAIMVRDGKLYPCRLLPQDGYENLSFEAYADPIGRYEIVCKEPAS